MNLVLRAVPALLCVALYYDAEAGSSCPNIFSQSRALAPRASTSTDLLAGREIRLRSMTEVSALVAAPSTEEGFKKSFGSSVTASAPRMNRIKAETAKLEKLGATLLKEADNSERRLAAALRDPSKRLIIIMAHNEGGQMRFPDGSAMHLRQLSDEAVGSGKLVIAISCEVAVHAPELGSNIRRPITIEEASLLTAAYLGKARSLSRSDQKMTYASFMSLGSSAEAGLEVIRLRLSPSKDVLIKTTVAIGTGLVLVALEDVCATENCERS